MIGVSGTVNVLATIPTFFFIDRLGRRILLISGATIMAVSMITIGALMGSYGTQSHNSTNTAVHVCIQDRTVSFAIIIEIYAFVAAFAAI